METHPPKTMETSRQIASTHENGQRKKLVRLILIAINYSLLESCNLDAATTLSVFRLDFFIACNFRLNNMHLRSLQL